MTIQEQPVERFFPAALGIILPALIQNAPSIVHAIQGGRREIVDGYRRTMAVAPRPEMVTEPAVMTEEALERSLPTLVSLLLPSVMQALPDIIHEVQGHKARGESREMTKSLFSAVATTVFNHCYDRLPDIVSALRREQGVFPERMREPDPMDPEVSQKFLGPIVGAILPAVLQTLPQLVETISGRE